VERMVRHPSHCAYLMGEAIRGHQVPSGAIRGHQGPSGRIGYLMRGAI
jgi:hypothetical protein